ncbi:MAG: HIT domain-containing protein [Candidatus Eisenbacteria sp.]|nr:HIT domain-containing protein [Candidatus Eisenbacteria bacterium]MCK5596023.1 HIT domain-containing protein [Candidatus Eisenbacteria bacterium]
MNRLWAPWRMEYLMSGSSEECIFCVKPPQDDDETNLILLRTPLSFVMLNVYPYNNGHLMIAPFRHVGSFTELTAEERCDVMDNIAHTERILGRAFSPQGMNVGANLGHCAGAGIPGHVHVHVVPRWEGDTNFMPVVGETRVLPETLQQTYRRLMAHLDK